MLTSLSPPVFVCPLSLQVVPQSVQLLQHEVHVRLGLRLVGDDGTEEVRKIPQWLVADHHAACLHHPALEYCRGSAQLVLPPVVSLLAPQPDRNVPETHV